jgi:RloB-like protein
VGFVQNRTTFGTEGTSPQSAVTVVVRAKGQAPKNLIMYASTMSLEEFDEKWCVVDTDEFDLDDAARIAAEKSVHLAVSNPCFELWLLLHHREWL